MLHTYGAIEALINYFCEEAMYSHFLKRVIDFLLSLFAILVLSPLLVLLIVYVGTCFVQLLTWSSVGYVQLGINTRYFVPLIALIPIIAGFNYFDWDKSKFDNYSIVFIIAFMAALILAFTTKYY